MNSIFKIALLLLVAPMCTSLFASEVIKSTAPKNLKQFIQSVLVNHPRLLEARAGLEMANANLTAATQPLYNPEIEIDSEKTDIKTSYLQLSQTIDIGDKQGARTKVSQSVFQQAQAEYTLAIQQLAHDLLLAIAQQQTREEIYKLAQKNLELMKEFADLSEQRHQAGDLSQVELNLARLAFSEVIMTYAQAASESTSANESLRAILGSSPDALPKLPEKLPEARIPDDQEKFLRNLPALRAQQSGVESARQTVKLRMSEQSWDPTISLRGGKEDKETLAGLTLTIPLNIRNSYKAELQVAQQQLLQSEYQALQFYRELRAKILTSTKRYQLLQDTWGKWQQTGKTSVTEQLKLIKQLWKAGDMSTTDYLVQLKQAIDTQTAGFELRGELWQSAFDWMNKTSNITTWLNLDLTDINQDK